MTTRLSFIQGDLTRVESLRRRLDDLAVLHEPAVAEDDAATLAEADRELEALTRAIGELEVRTLLPARTTVEKHW